MKHALYPCVEEMISPECLTALTGTLVRVVRLRPLDEREGVSGNQLFSLKTDNGMRFILKRMSWKRDWVMRASDDRRCRAVTLWQAGVLDRLLPEVSHAIIACARDDDGWAMLMQDVTGGLLPWDRYIDATANEHILQGLARQHARFWEASELKQPELGLCTLSELLQVTTPGPHAREVYASGWNLLSDAFEPELAGVLRELIADPTPLCDALARYPSTLVHGDFKVTNLAWLDTPQPQVIALDWQMAAVGLPVLDLGWYFTTNMSFPAPPERCIERYHAHLANLLGDRFDERRWRPMLALGMLATVVRSCCLIAWSVTQETRQIRRDNALKKLPMWSERVRVGMQWL